MCASVDSRFVTADTFVTIASYYTGHLPVSGMRIARQLGMITYRSFEEFNARFPWAADKDAHFTRPSFAVERYLQSKGDTFAANYDPNCYLLLSKATGARAQRHRLTPHTQSTHTQSHNTQRILHTQSTG